MVRSLEGAVAKNRPDMFLLLLLAISLGLNFFLGLQLQRAPPGRSR